MYHGYITVSGLDDLETRLTSISIASIAFYCHVTSEQSGKDSNLRYRKDTKRRQNDQKSRKMPKRHLTSDGRAMVPIGFAHCRHWDRRRTFLRTCVQELWLKILWISQKNCHSLESWLGRMMLCWKSSIAFQHCLVMVSQIPSDGRNFKTCMGRHYGPTHLQWQCPHPTCGGSW